MDHFPDSFWLGQNEEPMIALLDFIEAGGPVEELPAAPDAPGLSSGKPRTMEAGGT